MELVLASVGFNIAQYVEANHAAYYQNQYDVWNFINAGDWYVRHDGGLSKKVAEIKHDLRVNRQLGIGSAQTCQDTAQFRHNEEHNPKERYDSNTKDYHGV